MQTWSDLVSSGESHHARHIVHVEPGHVIGGRAMPRGNTRFTLYRPYPNLDLDLVDRIHPSMAQGMGTEGEIRDVDCVRCMLQG